MALGAALRTRDEQEMPAGIETDQRLLEGRRNVQCAEQRVIQEGLSPFGAQMRSAVSKGGDNSSPAGREEGMEKPKRARRRKLDTAKADLKPPLCGTRRAGCPP